MSAPPVTVEELRQSPSYQAGERARRDRIPLARAIACMRSGSWQYDAFIAGYDALTAARAAIDSATKEQSK